MGHANGDVVASGRTPLSTLDEVIGDFGVSSAGKITLMDYFEPYEYVTMDAGDRDLGSGGVTLLDPDTFKGTGVARMAVSIGKNGKAYVVNANNLGGFKQGSGGEYQSSTLTNDVDTNVIRYRQHSTNNRGPRFCFWWCWKLSLGGWIYLFHSCWISHCCL